MSHPPAGVGGGLALRCAAEAVRQRPGRHPLGAETTGNSPKLGAWLVYARRVKKPTAAEGAQRRVAPGGGRRWRKGADRSVQPSRCIVKDFGLHSDQTGRRWILGSELAPQGFSFLEGPLWQICGEHIVWRKEWKQGDL